MTNPGNEPGDGAGGGSIGASVAAGPSRLSPPAPIALILVLLPLGLLAQSILFYVEAGGPVSELPGEVTEVDRSYSSSSKSYSHELRIIDINGNRGGTGVSESVYTEAAQGEPITVERSRITGRVIAIRAETWETESGSQAIAVLLMAIAGSVLLALAIWLGPKVARLPARQRRRLLVRGASIILLCLIVFVGWSFRNRADANVDAALARSVQSSSMRFASARNSSMLASLMPS